MKTNNQRGAAGIATIIVIIIIIIGFVIWQKNSPSTENLEPATNNPEETSLATTTPISTPATTASSTQATTTIIVRYNGTVFIPATITINKGQSVTFINDTTGGMSVASDEHPTHTLYPEFDQYKTNARGQKEFTFTFTKIGTWDYHNHLNAGAVGTVIVK